MLKGRIESDILTAQKAGDSPRLNVLRLLISEIKNKEIEKRGKGLEATLSEEEVVDTLRREVKKRREAVVLFRSGGREDLASKDEKDISLIEEYLPPLMGREEIKKIIDDLHAQGNTDIPSLMRESMKILKGKADGAIVKEIIEARLKA